MIREATFWRAIGAILGISIGLSVIANSFYENAVPQQITLLLFGSLIALAVGSAIVNPRASIIRLKREDEARFRRGQYFIGFILSAVLALTMLVKDVRESPLVWLFAPVMVLPFILVLRERIKRG